MKRVMKTAVAVTAFGLAAALAGPAQAGTMEAGAAPASHDQPRDDDGLQFDSMLDKVVEGLLASSWAEKSSTSRIPAGERQGRALSGAAHPADLVRPGDAYVKPRRGTRLDGGGFAAVAPLLQGSFAGAMGAVPTSQVAPGGASKRRVEDLSHAVDKALPADGASGRLAPLVGHLAPTEASPVLDSLPGTTQVASVDEIAPLVEDVAAVASTNGTKTAGAYTDTVNSLGWSTAALTSAVQDPWHHR